MFLAFLICDPNWLFAKPIAFALAKSFAIWPSFKIVSFLEYLLFFSSVFFQKTTLMLLFNSFSQFFIFLIFDPNWPFCKDYSLCIGYSLCKTADFKIVSFLEYLVFFRVFFCTKQLLRYCWIVIRMFFIFFTPVYHFAKTTTFAWHIYIWPLQDDQFSKLSHFLNIWCFFEWFFA